ncbi:MAG: hypothetical protein CML66_04100 [Rhodobacteraceae bacterium]|nr:hypothetical protein [Paracoccaceae bacterium]MAY43673.1 hypothetical protein [Paracoccaceae bacterium]
MIDTFEQMDATALAALIRAKLVTADELLDTALDAMSAKNPGLNAVVVTFQDHARAAIARGLPDGPFKGVAFPVEGPRRHARRHADAQWIGAVS